MEVGWLVKCCEAEGVNCGVSVDEDLCESEELRGRIHMHISCRLGSNILFSTSASRVLDTELFGGCHPSALFAGSRSLTVMPDVW